MFTFDFTTVDSRSAQDNVEGFALPAFSLLAVVILARLGAPFGSGGPPALPRPTHLPLAIRPCIRTGSATTTSSSVESLAGADQGGSQEPICSNARLAIRLLRSIAAMIGLRACVYPNGLRFVISAA